MNREMQWLIPGSAGINHKTNRYGSRLVNHAEDGFRCTYCHAYIHAVVWLSGVQNRNHCPYCLRSRHLDLERAGDRLSACKALMQPIGLTLKHSRNRYGQSDTGELMLVHRCSECYKVSINRIAADDSVESLISVLQISVTLDATTHTELENNGIRLLQSTEARVVSEQLYGRTR